MTKTIYLLRHCESTDNKQGINGSIIDTTLSESGFLTAKELVPQLTLNKFDLIIASPLQRTSQTLKPFLDSLEKMPQIIIEPLTIERNLGIFTKTKIGDGKMSADQAVSGKSKTEWQPEGGESSTQVYARAKEFFKKICNRSERSILICGHQNFLRCLELIIRDEPINDMYFYSKSPARLDPGEIREYRFEA